METLRACLTSSSDFTPMEVSAKGGLSLLEIPPEILLIILTLLDAPDILNIRQTCRILCKTTYERAIWVLLLQDQEKYLPLPLDVLQAYHEDEPMHVYSTGFIEATVVKSRRIAKAWPRPRLAPPDKLRKETISATLMVLKLILERWLLAIYFDGVVRIYDVHSRDIVLRASLVVETLTFTSHAIAIDPSGERLTLALSHSLPPYVIDIYELNISCLYSQPPFTDKGFGLMRTMTLPFYKAVQAIEPTRKLLILSTPSGAQIEIINWDEAYNGEESASRGQMFRIDTEDVEALWNGVVAVRFFGSHILVFRTHSLEIYRYNDHTLNRPEPPGFVLKHAFNMTFREVSFSDYSITHNHLTEALIYEMDIFACDVIQGLFHYTVRLSVASSTASEMLPFLDIQLTSVYPLAQGVIEPLPSSVSAPDAPTSHPEVSMTYSANFSPSPSFTHPHIRDSHSSSTSSVASVHSRGNARNPYDFSSRGFISAQFLGPQGKRGVWVERKRTSTIREVQVWSRDPPSSSPFSGSALTSNSKRLLAGKQFRNSGATGISTFVSEMEGRVVYTLHSYDLRDDITMCTLGELSGTIALGHRSGEISIIMVET